MYDREATPFVPDYKFLSQVLETRQNRYDTNYKAINDAYSKLVYADLSKQENKDKRDQFANQIAPKMAQISGYDLSLRQNADMAVGVFAPFYEDVDIVRDLTNTANYKFGMKYADALSRSNDENQRGLWWQTGVDDLNIQMEKYLDMSMEDARNFTIGNYVANPNVHEIGIELLKEQGFNVEMDVGLDETRRYRVTQKNGDLVTDTAYAYLNNALMDDPRVLKGYATKARVDAYNFAKQQLQSGAVGSIKEGEEFWARTKIQEITEAQALLLGEKKKEAERLGRVKANWDEHFEIYNYPEGHSKRKTYNEAVQKYVAATLGVKFTRDLVNRGTLSVGGDRDLMNTAMKLYMGANIQNDFKKAAMSYSMIDFSIKLDEDPYALARYKQNLKDASAARERKRLMEEMNTLIPDFISPGNIETKINANGEVISTNDNIGETQSSALENMQRINGNMIEFILAVNTARAGVGQGGKITIDGVEYSDDQARELLSKPENISKLEKLYKNAENDINDDTGWTPAQKDVRNTLLQFPTRFKNDLAQHESSVNAFNQAAWDNFKIMMEMDESYGKRFRELIEDGSKNMVPTIFKGDVGPMIARDPDTGAQIYPTNMAVLPEDIDGIMSESEYVAKYIEWARANQKHFDREPLIISPTMGGGGLLTTTTLPMVNPAKAYDIAQNISEFIPFVDSLPERDKRSSFSKSFNEKEARESAITMFNEQKSFVNATLNGDIDFHATEANPEFKSPFQRSSYRELLEGVRPEDLTGGSGTLLKSNTYAVNPLAPGGEGYYDWQTLVAQINSGPGILQVSSGDIRGEDNGITLEQDEIAKGIIKNIGISMAQIINGQRDGSGNLKTPPGSKVPYYAISHNAIFGGAKDDDKQSGYVITFGNDEWLSAYGETLGFTKDTAPEGAGEDLANLGDFVNKYGNISVVVDQRFDLNRKSFNNVLNNNITSAINTQMQFSDTNDYVYDKKDGGYLRVYQTAGRYMYEFQVKGFNSNTGEFNNSINQTSQPLVYDPNKPAQGSNLVPIGGLDQAIYALQTQIDNAYNLNNQLEEAYLNKIKN